MNRGIAHELMMKLTGLPFIDKFGGLVRTLEKADANIVDGVNKGTVKKIPITDDFVITKSDCSPTEKTIDFIPDQKFNGMLYFEDYGAVNNGMIRKAKGFKSKLRIIIWLNTDKIVKLIDDTKEASYSVPTAIVADILEKFELLQLKTLGYYQRLNIKASIPVPGTDLFSKYTYDSIKTQYLTAPFECIGIDLEIGFYIQPSCIRKMAVADPQQTAIIYEDNNDGSYFSLGGCNVLVY